MWASVSADWKGVRLSTHLGNLFPADRLGEPWESRVSDALFYTQDGTMARCHERWNVPQMYRRFETIWLRKINESESERAREGEWWWKRRKG